MAWDNKSEEHNTVAQWEEKKVRLWNEVIKLRIYVLLMYK